MTSLQGPKETQSATWEAWILAALADLGRPSPRPAVHDWVYQHCGGAFKPADLLPRRRKGEVGHDLAWENNLDSAYDRLKKADLLVHIGHRAPWTLAAASAHRAELCLAALIPAPPADGVGPRDEADLLRDFKPGNGSAYRMHLDGGSFVRKRDHEPLLADFAAEAAVHGWRPINKGIFPRDLVLERADDTWLVEVKVLIEGKAVSAVREAVAQLLEYSYFWHPEEPPSLLAVFNEAVGGGMVRYLGHIGIEAVWRTGEGWAGSPGAIAAGLIRS